MKKEFTAAILPRIESEDRVCTSAPRITMLMVSRTPPTAGPEMDANLTAPVVQAFVSFKTSFETRRGKMVWRAGLAKPRSTIHPAKRASDKAGTASASPTKPSEDGNVEILRKFHVISMGPSP